MSEQTYALSADAAEFYEATFVPTRTNMFAASVAGAPITNFLSFAGAIHWTPGIAEFDHWETGQARMGVPFWEDMEAYIRNSPAAKVHELKTPMLMEFGDADGGIESEETEPETDEAGKRRRPGPAPQPA